MKTPGDRPVWIYVLFPGIAMLLGWGLRGYIGGGPFGAMIPGCFVALALCLPHILPRRAGSGVHPSRHAIGRTVARLFARRA